jgi:5-methylthioadenosine/S-adenosylhomocysteine deaminase
MSILIKKVLLNNEMVDIYIEGNAIKEIGGSLNFKAEINIDGSEKAVIPSFFNAHAHAAMTLIRGYADDMELESWLKTKIWPLEAKLTEEDVYWGAKLACLEMIKSGTTFFNDMYWHFHGTAKAAEEMGLRAAISAVFIDNFDGKKTREQIEFNEKLFQESKKYSERIIFALGPHAIYTVSEESLRWVKSFADKNNLLIHVHLSETENEVKESIKKYGLRPVEYLEKINFLGPNIIACHSIWLNETEIEILSSYNVKIVYNPVSNMKLGSGIFPYEKMKGKLNIMLGTDGCASNNNLDMLEEMKIGALLQKIKSKKPNAITAEEIFNMATINSAHAFNINAGEIKEGKLADLLLIDLKNIALNPRHNLISNLVYSANGNCVDTTICDGKILMQNRRVTGEEKIIKKANEAALNLIK